MPYLTSADEVHNFIQEREKQLTILNQSNLPTSPAPSLSCSSSTGALLPTSPFTPSPSSSSSSTTSSSAPTPTTSAETSPSPLPCPKIIRTTKRSTAH